MTRKAISRSQSSSQSRSWQLLVRHPLLLKVVTWLSSLSVMASATVSWAEIKPIEITTAASTASLFQSSTLSVEGPQNPLVSLTANDAAKAKQQQKLQQNLLGSNNFLVTLTPPATSRRAHYANANTPLAMQAPTAVDCNGTAQRLVSSLCSKVRPQTRPAVVAAFQSPLAPAVAPLPRVNARPLQRLAKLSDRQESRPATAVKPQVQVARPQALTTVDLTKPMNLYVAPPKTNAIPTIAALPQVSRPQVPTVAPLPTVQTARVGAALPAAMAMANYQISSDFIYPLATPAPVTSSFGWRTHPITGNRRFHAGMDLGAPTGTPIVAVASGRVVLARWHGGYGKTVIIEHSNGQLQTLYAHMSEIFVQEGQDLAQGTVIGHVGSTGNSTGPHLHFETKVPTQEGWMVVDPEQEVRYALSNLRQAIQLSRRN